MAKKQPKENPDLLQLGQKSRAGHLLSGYLRAIGTETDQVVIEDTPEGCPPGLPRIVSKAEALARFIWRKALPHKDDEGKQHEPDIRYVHIVLERVEGKAGVIDADKDAGRETIPEKVSRLGVERLNRIAKETMASEDVC